jgi:threonylcarbamoyladenosine tRNA methylthiotransferase MtaB
VNKEDPPIVMLEGFTDNYIKVETPFRAEWSNQIIDWKLV